MLELVERYLTLEDIVRIRKRMIGTGLIGGKTLGMLLARAILSQQSERPAEIFEAHDSFFIGSDVFYTYLVRNGVWWVRQNQRNPETFLDGADQARQNILTGRLPDYIVKQIENMLDYFGQSPIIVRSSSLLEDNFGNSFAGKYESVFCANQGSREKRLDDFLAAMRTIYASSMSEKALRYRAQRRLLDRDEQMALLVMRVSGEMHGRDFFPDMAGVGFSFNPYAWSEYIDPKAGVVRLVFGLGTRAVDRSDDDYTRIVALNAPNRRPEANFDEVRDHAQQRVDYPRSRGKSAGLGPLHRPGDRASRAAAGNGRLAGCSPGGAASKPGGLGADLRPRARRDEVRGGHAGDPRDAPERLHPPGGYRVHRRTSSGRGSTRSISCSAARSR